jgi:hypothetical protein
VTILWQVRCVLKVDLSSSFLSDVDVNSCMIVRKENLSYSRNHLLIGCLMTKIRVLKK